jgi:hypothetical protein
MWHYTLDGATLGPVSLQELIGLVRAGRLPRDVMVWREGLAEWMPAERIPKLAHDLALSGPGRVAAAAAVEPQPPPAFFAVSRAKLIVLSVASLGVYEAYWFYKHWQRQRERTEEDLSPVWRTVFAVFFAYDLFTRLRDQAEQRRVGPAYPAGWMAAAYVVPSLLFRLPDPWWLLTLLSMIPLVLVQGTANAINAVLTPEADTNARFSGANAVVLALGVVLWLLLLVGFLMQAAGEPL